jgi:deoxyribonuclease V
VTTGRALHSWSVTPADAIRIQRELADRVIRRGSLPRARWVAGADAAFSSDGTECIAGVVLWDKNAEQVVEEHVVRRRVRFPYIPGLLSFREAPAVIAGLRRLRHEPDVIILDGQGYAHPRRFGLASHVGVQLNRPTIGCAKSPLIGQFEVPRQEKGSSTPLMDRGECIGAVLRTRTGVKPVFVSIGHRITLRSAVALVMACTVRFRLPEPTRLADRLVAAAKREWGKANTGPKAELTLKESKPRND